MTASDAERNRPAPAHPALFWSQVLAVPVVAAGIVAALLATGGVRLYGMDELSGGTVLALATAVVLVAGGELWPIIGSRTLDPSGVAWSTTFAFALLLHAGLVPAVTLLAAAAALSGIMARRAAFRWLYNAGQYALSLTAAWGVLVAFDRNATPVEVWAPRTLTDVAVVLLAAAAYFAVNELLVTCVVSALTGTSVVDDLRSAIPFELAANGAQLALAPLVAVVMLHAPQLTLVAVLPVAAIHRSAAAERESRHAATHDDLTQLANRKHFVAVSETAIEEAMRTGGSLAVLVVDLDRFKEVNDVLGHPVGDRVIREVADRLRAGLREHDVVGRLGGDEFSVLVPSVTSEPDVRAVVERMRTELERPFDVDGHVVDLAASIGFALVPEHGEDFETVFTRADTAMFAAKREGTGIRAWTPELDTGTAVRLSLLGALRRALEAGDLVVEYQPTLRMHDRTVGGMEALVRWRRADGGVLLPDEFLPLAEQSGLMPRITGVVLDQALAQCATWGREGLRVPVAVNVSLRDVLDPGFAVEVASRLVRFGVVAPLLTLEITERVLADDLARVRTTLEELADIGVRVALDDFGTGWSSLALLRHLPVSEIKLDPSFVGRATSSRADAAIVRAMTDLAHELELRVTGEGVETGEVWEALADLGCDTAQGWYVAPPMTAAEATRWLACQPATATATVVGAEDVAT